MNSITSFLIRLALTIVVTWVIYAFASGVSAPSDKDPKVWGEVAPAGHTQSLEPSYPEIDDGTQSMWLRGCYYPCYNIA